ncbi:MAG: EscR/YscR/HrcR family type III secretion system export apparatus protein [Myxococcaceae bacterium]
MATVASGVDAWSASPLPLVGLLAVFALVPFGIVMLTCFSKILVVLSLARSAMGAQQVPPTLVLTGLAAVLSAAVMAPVFERMYATGAQLHANVSGAELMSVASRASKPLHDFLVRHGSADERARFIGLARELRTGEGEAVVEGTHWFVVVPAFVMTELKEAFRIGFLIFLPFLVLDMVMANVLLALGMQTLSPTQVSLPFKVLLFVAVDGWSLLASGLMLGYR